MPLDRQDPARFREDLARIRDELQQVGGAPVLGFRAPIFSLTERTAWAYATLAELGLRYSSSVLPHHGPLYGSRLLNALMYIGRGRVLPRVRSLFALGFVCETYGGYVHGLGAGAD